MKTIVITLLWISIIFLSIGCSYGSSKFIGIWVQTDNPKYILELLSDNTVVYDEDGLKSAGKWTILNGSQVSIEISVLGIGVGIIGSLKGDILTLKGEGHEYTYKKMK